MRTKKFVAFATILLLVALAVNVAVAAADQHSGTWKMKPRQVEVQSWASGEDCQPEDRV